MKWLSSPAHLTLASQDVHVWRMWLDQPEHCVETLAQTLSPDERSRAGRFRSIVGQRRFAVARGFLRAVLGRYLEIAPAQVRFAYTPEGKPYLPPARGQGLGFNLSHSRSVALCAVARAHAVGADVEYLHPLPEVDQIVERFFSPGEARRFQSVSPAERPGAFFDAWTRKEACLKALGRGMGQGLDRVEVTFLPAEPVGIVAIDGDRRPAEQWSLFSLTPAPHYAAAIAVAAQNVRLSHLFELNDCEPSLACGPA